MFTSKPRSDSWERMVYLLGAWRKTKCVSAHSPMVVGDGAVESTQFLRPKYILLGFKTVGAQKWHVILVNRANSPGNVTLRTWTPKLWWQFYPGTQQLVVSPNNVSAVSWPQDHESPLYKDVTHSMLTSEKSLRCQQATEKLSALAGQQRAEAMATFQQNIWQPGLSLAWPRTEGVIQALENQQNCCVSHPSLPVAVCLFASE